MTPEEFDEYATEKQQADAMASCRDFCDYADGMLGNGGQVAYGPGHVVVDDYNWHLLDGTLEDARAAVRARLDGGPEEHADLTLTQLAATVVFLEELRGWMGTLPKT